MNASAGPLRLKRCRRCGPSLIRRRRSAAAQSHQCVAPRTRPGPSSQWARHDQGGPRREPRPGRPATAAAATAANAVVGLKRLAYWCRTMEAPSPGAQRTRHGLRGRQSLSLRRLTRLRRQGRRLSYAVRRSFQVSGRSRRKTPRLVASSQAPPFEF